MAGSAPIIDGQGRRRAGRVAVVTGGSRGIGRSFVVEAARRGYDVVFGYRVRASEAREVAALAGADGRSVTPIACDLTTAAGVTALVDAARAAGPVGVLVNNAGTSRPGPLADITEDGWDEVLALDLAAPLWLTKQLEADLRATRGCVLNVSSVAGVAGSVQSIPYGAAKAGLLGLTKSLARALAPDVRVNAVCPGAVSTELVAALSPEQLASVLADTLIPRAGDPDEIAAAGLDVAEWTYCTGQTIVLDGGRVLH